MPLPPRKERITFVDGNQNIVSKTLEVKDTGYKPTSDYHPTMRAVKCLKCKAVGALEFAGGVNLKLGDRVMEGKPVPGVCPRCGQTELIPLPVNDPKTKEVAIFYQVQRSLDFYTQHGIPNRGMLWPVDRILEWEKHARQQQA